MYLRALPVPADVTCYMLKLEASRACNVDVAVGELAPIISKRVEAGGGHCLQPLRDDSGSF